VNKTTLEGLEEALERLEQIDGVYSWGHLLFEVREALAEQTQLQQAKEMLLAVDDVVKQSIDDIKTLSCAGFVSPTMTLKTEASQVKTMTPEEYKTFIEPVKQEPVAKERILELAKQERVLIPGLIGFQDNLVEFARAVIKVYQEKNK